MFSLSLSILEIKISYDKIFQKQHIPFGSVTSSNQHFFIRVYYFTNA
jgi:hypothetical protein